MYTQPTYCIPTTHTRMARLKQDSIDIKWIVTGVQGGMVNLNPAAGDTMMPETATAWRAGGAADGYIAATRCRRRSAQRKTAALLQHRMDHPTYLAATLALESAWGDRAGGGYCAQLPMRLAQPDALVNAAKELVTARVEHGCSNPSLASALVKSKLPLPTLTRLACKKAACQTRCCRYAVEGMKAHAEAQLKRRIDGLVAAGVPSPTRAAAATRPRNSPGAGVQIAPAQPPDRAPSTTVKFAKRAKTIAPDGPVFSNRYASLDMGDDEVLAPVTGGASSSSDAGPLLTDADVNLLDMGI